MDWNYFKIRRRTTLESFLSDVSSESEALELFEKKGLSNPPLAEIKQLFAPKQVQTVNKQIEQVADSSAQSVDEVQPLLPAKKTKVVSGSTGN